MSVSKSLQISISLPFSYTRTRDPQSGIVLVKRPEREMVYKYVQALAKEIVNCAGGMDDVEIDAVRFVGGEIHFLWEQDLRLLMEKVLSCFKVSKDAEFISYAVPGRMTAGPVKALKEFGFEQMIDIPSFDLSECRGGGIAYKAGQSLQAYSGLEIPVKGLRTSLGLVARSAQQWACNQEEIMKMEPSIIEFTPSAFEQDQALQAEFFDAITTRGYTQVRPNIYTRDGVEPVYQYDLESEYLGVGLDAQCRLDGYYTRNTDDMSGYIQCADDYTKLYRIAEKYD